MTIAYKTLHLEISGRIKDRETATPDLKLELRPLGTALPEERQTQCLQLRIGAISTEVAGLELDTLVDWLIGNTDAGKRALAYDGR